jgi:phosphonate transport system ATP-binding protein
MGAAPRVRMVAAAIQARNVTEFLRSRPRALVISALGVAKHYGERRVLDGLTFGVTEGESVALIGANGSGKSTLLRLLVRLTEPDSGRLRVLDRDLRSLDRTGLRDLRRRVGFVFQSHNLVGRVSVLSNVLHGALGRVAWPLAVSHGLAPQALRAEAMACLAEVGLEALAVQRVDSLSGGQSQRVAIARALMQRPVLLLADEPAASLDPASSAEVMGVFRDLVARNRLTLVFSSHNLDHARGFADRVIGLRNGRIEVDCPAAELDDRTADALYT